MNFTFFCEAQMVWDSAMAVHALRYLTFHPDATVVILTGSAMRRKAPYRADSLRSPVPVAVFLPEVPGTIDPKTVDLQDADFLLMGAR